jgi:catechol 2,3-dioxygenase-like lactoylglutathione lyase family enzyme
MSGIAFEGATPILPVKDVKASVDHYVNVLGFELDWGGGDIFASVSRGPVHLFLSQGDQGHAGTWVWIGVSDVARLHEEYATKGAKIRHPPTSYPWAFEMQVEDPDGHVLRMGSDAKKGEPTGEWLDMRGDRWKMDADGDWTRVPPTSA